ncbi:MULTISPECIES: hypothetical protein [Streptomyces]|uniref:Holin n=1 Tax=Streptomyces tsukubensis (strain DSM 42081 / NBRC 108919 / NRRL 18488 / 9993) TaxID=1114943 RepID=I2N4B3_STRT9|nr:MULTISPECIES: hypothetical protein [Streptomyces]AZK95923.1 hypothetical protein B7R87_20200 [Streptomyces tsukubensis]EIF91860.1 hypothetical protein [Streptomyces tsukubensis NRRL18488]MYS68536.1 hypothetical protein [Streptomyces sp. SID5473]QKM68058.1 hypothetical protein STSU_013585 [Streptomyces tsukubensis NRRL18488]TAI44458.1 hypothetical protein EWI31_13380 [Streptomyces tsukubensis]
MSEAARRTARTVLQTAVGIAVALPAIVDASGLPATLPWVAVALAVSGALARIMALPSVQRLLPARLGGYRSEHAPEGAADGRS